jgi:hypothetical protein
MATIKQIYSNILLGKINKIKAGSFWTRVRLMAMHYFLGIGLRAVVVGTLGLVNCDCLFKLTIGFLRAKTTGFAAGSLTSMAFPSFLL